MILHGWCLNSIGQKKWSYCIGQVVILHSAWLSIIGLFFKLEQVINLTWKFLKLIGVLLCFIVTLTQLYEYSLGAVNTPLELNVKVPLICWPLNVPSIFKVASVHFHSDAFVVKVKLKTKKNMRQVLEVQCTTNTLCWPFHHQECLTITFSQQFIQLNCQTDSACK